MSKEQLSSFYLDPYKSEALKKHMGQCHYFNVEKSYKYSFLFCLVPEIKEDFYPLEW